ncbi:MAG: hypothetical protein DIU69_09330 [Bacillota bacterium]|nr:MAG: hypothetical protein DIU69_09330 [Bacillota bacterium]
MWPDPDPNRNVVDLDKVNSLEDLRKQLSFEGWHRTIEGWRRCGAGMGAWLGVGPHPAMPDGVIIEVGDPIEFEMGLPGQHKVRDVIFVLEHPRHPGSAAERVARARELTDKVIVVKAAPWWEKPSTTNHG